MYEAFYGLSEKPFNLTPDPKYLFLSEKHKEAFAHLLYGIKSGSGFVMVTGEIGTGKTTICRNLVSQLDPETELAFIFNPSLKPVELIRKILAEFGVTPRGDNVLDLVEELNVYLLDAKSRGRNCVLLIDEAQNLSPQVLEQIRLLSNLETETEKLLQIVLVGQPELGEMLALHELRQLNQRITARYHLKELDEKETLQYVAYRLHAAGGRRSVRFNRSAVRQVYKRSGGTPRVINAICDRALLIGYTKEAHVITSAIVKQAAVEIRGEKVTTGKRRKEGRSVWRWLPSPLILAALVIAYVLAQQYGPALGEFADGIRMFREVARVGIPAVTQAPPDGQQSPAPTVEAAVAPPAAAPAEPAGEADPAVAVPDLPVALAAMDPAATCRAAGAALLEAWGVTPPEELPANPEALASLAEAAGLDHERLEPALSQLVALGLPAAVRLRVGGEDGTDTDRWVALLGVDGDRLRLGTETGATVEVAWGGLLPLYAREAVVFWRDEAPRARDLLPGQQGRQVAALRARLHAVGRLDRAGGDTYDIETQRAVYRLQAETGLTVDGIAGRQVRMALSGLLGGAGVPALAPREAVEVPEAPTAAVARADTPASAPAPPVADEAPAPEATPEVPAVPSEGDAAPEAVETEATAVEAPVATPENTEAEAPEAEEAPAPEPEPEPQLEPEPRPETDGGLVSIEDLEVPFFPAGLGPLSPLDLKERTEPAPPLTPPGGEAAELEADTEADTEAEEG